MQAVQLWALAFLAGLTAMGTAATLFELAARQTLRFAAPFVSAGHFPRSLAAVVLAGPFMLGNDALDAHRAGIISRAFLAACGLAACLWTFAVGVLLLSLAARAAVLL